MVWSPSFMEDIQDRYTVLWCTNPASICYRMNFQRSQLHLTFTFCKLLYSKKPCSEEIAMTREKEKESLNKLTKA